MNSLKQIAPQLALFIISTALYAGTLGFGFSLDDSYHLVSNDNVKSPDYAAKAFVQPTWPGNLYRPTLGASLALTYAVADLKPLTYHLTNVAAYAATAILAYLFLLHLMPGRFAFIAALLFTLHPLHVEAVANVSHRSEIFACGFGLAGLYLALSYSSLVGAVCAAGLFLLAFLSKESALAFLPILGCALLAIPERKSFKLPMLAACTAAGMYVGLRIFALGSFVVNESKIFYVVNPIADLPPLSRAANALVLLGQYLLLSLFPANLSHDYSFAETTPITDFSDPHVVICLALLAGLLSLFAWAVIRRDSIWLWPAWFAASIAVQSNVLFPIGTVFAERLMFTPLLAVCAIAALTIGMIRSRTLQLSCVVLLCVLLSAKTLVQQRYWHDNTTLHSAGIALAPRSAKAQQNYAIVLMNDGKFTEAIDRLKGALDIYPAYGDAAFRIGLCYEALKQDEQARFWFSRASEIQPNHTASRNALGWRLVKQQRFKQAAPFFEESRRIDPKNFRASLGLFAVAIAQDDLEEAAKLNAWLAEKKPNDKRYQLWRKVFIAKLQLRSQAHPPQNSVQKAAQPETGGASPDKQLSELQ